MSTPPQVFGWCPPGALRPMQSGDGLVVRVRTPPMGGRLSTKQARGIAALSTQFGSGTIDLSARANLQLRGGSARTPTRPPSLTACATWV